MGYYRMNPYIIIPATPAMSIVYIGFNLNFLRINKLTAKRPAATKFRSDNLIEKSSLPNKAVKSIEKPAEAINATTAGRSPLIIPCTMLSPLNL